MRKNERLIITISFTPTNTCHLIQVVSNSDLLLSDNFEFSFSSPFTFLHSSTCHDGINCRICVDQNAEQERQLRSLQLEMETIQRQFDASSVDRENAIQENRKLQDDLAAVTCEVRNMQRELEASRAEAYDLKRQLQTYVSEVRRAEELLNRKVGSVNEDSRLH